MRYRLTISMEIDAAPRHTAQLMELYAKATAGAVDDAREVLPNDFKVSESKVTLEVIEGEN